MDHAQAVRIIVEGRGSRTSTPRSSTPSWKSRTSSIAISNRYADGVCEIADKQRQIAPFAENIS